MAERCPNCKNTWPTGEPGITAPPRCPLCEEYLEVVET